MKQEPILNCNLESWNIGYQKSTEQWTFLRQRCNMASHMKSQ